MKNSLRVIGAALLCAAAASATDYQRYEIFAGYSFVRFNPNSGFIPSFNANGGNGQVVYNFNRWFGAAFDAGAVTKGVLGGFNVDTTVANFVGGPRFTWHMGRFRPYGQVLFGGAYATTSTGISLLPAVVPTALPPGLILPPGLPVSARLVASNTNFAMLAGGGLDIKISKHVFFRPVEASYYLTRLPSFLTTGNTTNRNNFRYSAGINFMFGEPR
jgi:opacity protein-like surface antigen